MPIRWLKTSIESGRQKLPSALSFLSKENVPFIAVAQRDVGSRTGVWHVEVPTAFLKRVIKISGNQKFYYEAWSRLSKDHAAVKMEVRRTIDDLQAAHAKDVAALANKLQKVQDELAEVDQARAEAVALAATLNMRIADLNGDSQGPEPRSPIQQPFLEGTDLGRRPLPGSFGSGKRR